jgi:hypothetical protein
MSNKVYLLDEQGKMKEMVHSLYESEDILQSLVADYPQLLAGEQIDQDAPRRWLLVSREMSVGDDETNQSRWSIDHLFLDQEAIPTLVEVKRSSDTRIRREVVGQMMDYAANAVLYWPVDAITAAFEKTCEERGTDADFALEAVLGGRTVEQYWDAVKTNLQAGKIRMLFVADRIPKELKRIVEFLNQQMDPAEILAIEINRYKGEGHTAVVPVLLGNTLESQSRKQGGTRLAKQWDRASFLDEIHRKCGDAIRDASLRFIEWTEKNGMRPWWGKGSRDGSYIPVFEKGTERYYPVGIWTYGRVEIQFQYLKDQPVFEHVSRRQELAAMLRKIPGVTIPEDSLERRPTFPLEVLKKDENIEEFLAIMAWIKMVISAV